MWDQTEGWAAPAICQRHGPCIASFLPLSIGATAPSSAELSLRLRMVHPRPEAPARTAALLLKSVFGRLECAYVQIFSIFFPAVAMSQAGTQT